MVTRREDVKRPSFFEKYTSRNSETEFEPTQKNEVKNEVLCVKICRKTIACRKGSSWKKNECVVKAVIL